VNIRTKEIESGIVVLEMLGNIRMGADCQHISREVDQLIGKNQTRVIFDFALVDYLDSAGIGTLVSCLTKLKNAGGNLRLASLKPMVEGVFKLTKINTIIGIFPSVAEAAQNYSSSTQPGP
jgi:anti-sigma B factor antagonist